MMAEAGGSTERRGLSGGAGAATIALVYAVVGPLVGAVLVLPFATVAAVQLSERPLTETLLAVFSALPFGLLFSYESAGAISLATGIVVAAVAYRRGAASATVATVVPILVFVAFAIFFRFVHVDMFRTAILRAGGPIGMLIWLAVCVASSFVCWLITLPIQRRIR